MNTALIDRFENLLRSTGRDGIDNLINFIRKSDFYTAPAYTKYHSCHEGGLLEHSMYVYDCLLNLMKTPPWNQFEFAEDSMIISALLHDVCKTYFYVVETKNKKEYSEHGSKTDSQGKFDWVSYQGYTINDQYPYGHGEKSVMMIENFIRLTPEERYAIRWHMGFSDQFVDSKTLSAAIKKYPLILALSTSDMAASFLIEKEE